MSEPPNPESTEVNPVAKSAAERFAARKALAEKLAAKQAAEEAETPEAPPEAEPAEDKPAAEESAAEEPAEPEPVAEEPEPVVEEPEAPAADEVVEPLVIEQPEVEEHLTGELKIEPEPEPQPEPRPEPQPVRDEEFESFSSGSLAGELPEPRMKLLAVLAAVVLALDLITKTIAVAFLEDAAPIKLFGGTLYLTFVRNPGAAFGLAEGMTWILALIAIGVVVFILWISRNLRSLGWAIGLGCVLGGAVGNLIDRLFRAPAPMQGHVVDFLSLFDPYGRVWPVFNVADSAIVCGGALIVYMALRQRDYDGTVHKKKVSV